MLFSNSMLAAEVPFGFDVTRVARSSAPPNTPGNPAGFKVSQFSGQTFSADSYGELVGQIASLAKQGEGSGIGDCSQCDCATLTPDDEFVLADSPRGAKGTYRSNIRPGPYSASIGTDQYPAAFTGSETHKFCISVDTVEGAKIKCGESPPSILVDFEYSSTTCTVVSFPGEPMEYEFTTTDQIGFLSALNPTPCPQNFILYDVGAGTRVCLSGSTGIDSLRVGLLSELNLTSQSYTSESKDIFQAGTLDITIPLGTVSRLEIVAPSLGPQPIEVEIETSVVADSPADGSIYPQDVVVEINEDVLDEEFEEEKFILAAHLGVSELEIDADGVIYKVNVTVEEPSRLGEEANAFDDRFITIANKLGVSPILLKSIAFRESIKLNDQGDLVFDPTAYRYEPFWDQSNVSFNPNIMLRRPYRSYRLLTPNDYDETGVLIDDSFGSLLQLKDKDLRNEFYIYDSSGNSRVLNSLDEFVSAYQLIEANDEGEKNGRPKVSNASQQNWLKETSAQRRLNFRPEDFDFVAQTNISASYGIMQVLYTTAAEPYLWTGANLGQKCVSSAETCDPFFLFDTSDNIEIGQGSVGLAGRIVANGFLETGSPEIASVEELALRYIASLADYNEDPSYGNQVFTMNVNRSLPVPQATSIFR